MTTCLVAFGFAFLVACAATISARHIALRVGIVDKPDGFRKVHQREVPLLGGIAVYVAFGAPIAVLFLGYRNAVSDLLHQHGAELGALLAGGAVVVAAGVVDDVRGLPARWKLLVQIVAASIAFAGGYAIRGISNPFGGTIVLGLLSFPVTVFWFVGCMNAVNFLDGLDGLAAGVCLFASVALFLVSLFFGNVVCMLLMACLSGAILGFLLFNFHPASIFLGDSGSMLLGFLVGALSLLGARKTEAAIALLIPIILLGLPILDAVLAVLRRWLRKVPISAADRQHIHHVLLSMGLSHKQVVLILYGACVALCVAALLVTAGRSEVTLMVLGSLAVVAFVCTRVFGGLRFFDVVGRISRGLEHSQRSGRARVSVEKAVARMKRAPSVSTVWLAFSEALESLDLDYARLHLKRVGRLHASVLHWPDGRPWTGEQSKPVLDAWSALLSVHSNGHAFGELELRKSVLTSSLLPEAPELAERLRHELSGQVERLSAVTEEAAVLRSVVGPS
ncbi:MAG: undecaprenyl/decaprenyl-phosphate alpha-N-acetylglucosaminyl 1-phosphate transferase [Candidatus Brocadiae bacterium]|nr:undecaprenyl/decaprenyl-phosphate alpha-N-acetylglucosaminyl 1-phosphate transferase [Candidatus Brocadiia bacterium]